MCVHSAEGVEPVVRIVDDWGPQVLVATVFRELVAGTAAIRDLAREVAGVALVDVVEAVGDDPLRLYRPM